ncbi:DUF2797 domain-containing protein [Rubeoparvulum massiliense]|uniref:DUF2797 domain-containing protein n=1 Tax=Rubeoparvulum massiliense TaxID=1631346 RepID=UPI00065E83D9|nr:DUF2797 domain-containing protein [Rubeoparvulum massiliense]
MQAEGIIQRLSHQYADPVEYYLALQDEEVSLNEVIGHPIKIQYAHAISCIACGRSIKKTYNSGYCYPCFQKLPENDLCIVKPSLCHFAEGTCRDSEFGEQHCMIPHYVYLAISSGIKVGLTRKNNELKRWIDQGAVRAIPIAECTTRKRAGELELFLTDYLPDKTNWRKMLKGEVDEADLFQLRQELTAIIPEEFQQDLLTVDEITEITYPQLEQLKKIQSIQLDKQDEIEDRLIGIKGQYLILEHGVFHVRKHAGYHIQFSWE